MNETLEKILEIAVCLSAVILVMGLIIRDLRNPGQSVPESPLEMTASVDNARDPEGGGL